jgi:hypothetical protein
MITNAHRNAHATAEKKLVLGKQKEKDVRMSRVSGH